MDFDRKVPSLVPFSEQGGHASVPPVRKGEAVGVDLLGQGTEHVQIQLAGPGPAKQAQCRQTHNG